MLTKRDGNVTTIYVDLPPMKCDTSGLRQAYANKEFIMPEVSTNHPDMTVRYFYNFITNRLIVPIKVSYGNRIESVNAMWDTGATHGGISKRLVDKLGIQSVGSGRLISDIGEGVRNRYLINYHLSDDICFRNYLVFDTDFYTEGTEVDVIIGMDIISQGRFCIENADGKTVLSFTCNDDCCFDNVDRLLIYDNRK